MRRSRLWIAAVVALAALGLFASPLVGSTGGPEPEAPADEQLVSTHEEAGYIWPYTSPTPSVADRTLAINVVVRGDPERVRRVLVDRSEANWTDVENETRANVEIEEVPKPAWAPAHGSARYTYVASDSGTGLWIDSTYQLAVGTYLGSRTHVRAYAAPAGDWTAMQAHTEYWDWFRLGHTVTGVSAGAHFAERDLRDEPSVAVVSREYHGHEGGGSDGWITVVELVPATVALAALPLATLRTAVRRRVLADLALPLALVAVPLGVRVAGVTAEGLFPGADPKLIAALFYPVFAAGPPVAVGALARGRQPERAALLAATGFGAGLVVDLGTMGVRMVAVSVVLHRLATVAALGVLALGVARADRRTAVAGLGAWVFALAGAALGII